MCLCVCALFRVYVCVCVCVLLSFYRLACCFSSQTCFFFIFFLLLSLLFVDSLPLMFAAVLVVWTFWTLGSHDWFCFGGVWIAVVPWVIIDSIWWQHPYMPTSVQTSSYAHTHIAKKRRIKTISEEANSKRKIISGGQRKTKRKLFRNNVAPNADWVQTINVRSRCDLRNVNCFYSKGHLWRRRLVGGGHRKIPQTRKPSDKRASERMNEKIFHVSINYYH